MKKRACLIFNPVAGQSNPDQDLETIERILSPEIELDIQLTTEEVDADRLAKKAYEKGFDIIIASGGDGTISAVAGALVGTNIPLGVLPGGTANAFAIALAIPDRIEEATQTILAGFTRKVDVGLCNGKPMLLLAGIGFGAETIGETSREAKNRWGMLAYLISGIEQLHQLEKFEVEIETEDQIIRSIMAGAVTVANAAPPTSILAQGPAGVIWDDGLLDVTIVAVENWRSAIAASYHLLQTGLRGDAAKRDDIGYLRARSLKITANPPQKILVDGELIGTTPMEVECVPGGLRVFVPMIPEENPPEKLEGLPGLEIEPKSE